VRTLPYQLASIAGAFLLFLIQPLIAKQILPWFGGSATVWSACLMFFQVMLVAGYAFAHLSRRLGPAKQGVLFLALGLAALALSLPVAASPEWAPPDGATPVTRVIGVLLAAVGLPAFLLAATAPLVQDWFARAEPGRSPYALYVLSNIGSLGALLVFPTVIEPALTIPRQSLLWSGGFVAFMAMMAWCAWRVRQAAAVPVEAMPIEAASRADLVDRVLWVALPAIGSGLLLATTSGLTQDIAPVPLLWVVPLSVYLLTFILAFAGWYSRWIFGVLFAASVVALPFLVGEDRSTPVPWQIAVLLFLFAMACMVCHGELARLKPRPQDLTSFYLALSIGGAIGGAAVALGAPLAFDSYLERPVLTVLAMMLLGFVVWRDVALRWPGRVAWLALLVVIAVIVGVTRLSLPRESRADEVARGRSFYGVLRVTDEPASWERGLRRLYHGRILHGSQFMPETLRRQVTSYYTAGSGIEVALNQHPSRLASQPIRIGVAGLGTGTVAGWAQRFDHLTFFEIDPLVVEMSSQYFTYIKDSTATVDIVMGDARLSLERQVRSEQNQHSYDLLAMDAFSGDAIPVHLLTRECFAIYQRALKADGIIAVHVSNRYLDIRPVVRGAAAELGYEVLEIRRESDTAIRANGSTWLLLTRNQEFLDRARSFAVPDPETTTLVWTDAFSSLMAVLRPE
jgi:spermidine synthase